MAAKMTIDGAHTHTDRQICIHTETQTEIGVCKPRVRPPPLFQGRFAYWQAIIISKTTLNRSVNS